MKPQHDWLFIAMVIAPLTILGLAGVAFFVALGLA